MSDHEAPDLHPVQQLEQLVRRDLDLGLEESLGGHDAGDDRGARRPEPATVRDRVVRDEPQRRPLEAVAREGVRDRAHHEVRLVTRHLALADAVHLDLESVVDDLDVELVVLRKREPERVEARAEVGRGRGHLDVHTAPGEIGRARLRRLGRSGGHEPSPSSSATCATSAGTTVGCTSEPSESLRTIS